MSTSVKISNELKKRIQYLAEVRHRSAHWIMKEAIAEYVEKEEAKEKFKQEAIDSWKSYQETGLHLTSKETRDWLNTWGDGNEVELPECHK